MSETLKVDLSTQVVDQQATEVTPVADQAVDVVIPEENKKPSRRQKKQNSDDIHKVDLTAIDVATDASADVQVVDKPAEEVVIVENAENGDLVIDTDLTYAGFGESIDEIIADADVENNTANIDFELPENVQSLVKFMQDTNGTIEDYIRLNSDYSKVDPETLLKEYYKKTRPHLDAEEINFLLEDNFSYDEDYDDEKTIRSKKLAAKEELAKARKYLEDIKEQYYKEIKSNKKLLPEEKEAIDFYTKYKQENLELDKGNQERASYFMNETKKVFADFKGFEFNVGDKKVNFNVKNPKAVMDYQSNIENFVKEFLDDNSKIKDAKGYHKALFAAKNADTLANHFYEQGKADAIREITAKSKNIDMNPRGTHQPSGLTSDAIKVRSLESNDNSRLRIKTNR
jgi:hypothetical protein